MIPTIIEFECPECDYGTHAPGALCEDCQDEYRHAEDSMPDHERRREAEDKARRGY